MVESISMSVILTSVALATSLAFIGLGGGLYEFSVIDPAWPLDLITCGAMLGAVVQVARLG